MLRVRGLRDWNFVTSVMTLSSAPRAHIPIPPLPCHQVPPCRVRGGEEGGCGLRPKERQAGARATHQASLYLLFIVFLGGRLVRWLFPNQQPSPTLDSETDTSVTEEAPAKPFWSRLGNRAVGIGVAAIIVAVSYALSLVIPIDNSTAVIIILLTTLSIALSFWNPLKKLENTFDTGLYFVYVFCLAVATMVNIRELEFSRYLFILWYIAFAVFGSLLLQLLFAKLLKIDGDLTLTASISLINSPPFVPMVAAVLNNKSVILPGIAIGLLGYAVGNYLGIGIFMLLSALG